MTFTLCIHYTQKQHNKKKKHKETHMDNHVHIQPLLYLHNMKIIDSYLKLEDLSDFDFQIVYTPGKENTAIDALSRWYDPRNLDLSAGSLFNPEQLPEGLMVIERIPGGGNSLIEILHCITMRMKLTSQPQSSYQMRRELLVDELLKGIVTVQVTFFGNFNCY